MLMKERTVQNQKGRSQLLSEKNDYQKLTEPLSLGLESLVPYE